MNVARFVSGVVSIGVVLGLVAGLEGCGGDVQCEACGCESDGCTSTTTGTETGTQTGTQTGTETGTQTGTGTATETTTTSPPSPAELCNKVCDCMPDACSGGIGECVSSLSETVQDAIQADCKAAVDALLSCYESLPCENGGIDFSPCEPVAAAFEECMQGPPPDPTECVALVDQIIGKYESCGIDVEPGEPPDCSPEILEQLACFTPCILEAPCSVFGENATDAEIEAYSSCISLCE